MGKELFYITGDAVMAVHAVPDGTFRARRSGSSTVRTIF